MKNSILNFSISLLVGATVQSAWAGETKPFSLNAYKSIYVQSTDTGREALAGKEAVPVESLSIKLFKAKEVSDGIMGCLTGHRGCNIHMEYDEQAAQVKKSPDGRFVIESDALRNDSTVSFGPGPLKEKEDSTDFYIVIGQGEYDCLINNEMSNLNSANLVFDCGNQHVRN